MKNLLPNNLFNIIHNKIDENKLYELRFRVDAPVMINYGGVYKYLTIGGVSDCINGAIYTAKSDILSIIDNATQHSLYAVHNQLKNGFITVNGGIRIGICGEVVYESDNIKTIKNFSSLNIRFPHQVKGCSNKIYNYIIDDKIQNTLILSPPGMGKTTILRDLCRQISQFYNVLLVDERNELAFMVDGKAKLDVGYRTDIISNCNKEYAFSYGIRSMKPDCIITDELGTLYDINCVEHAIVSGVNVIASLHAKDMEDFTKNTNMKDLIKNKYFNRYVILSDRKGLGCCDGIFDGNLKCIYFGD